MKTISATFEDHASAEHAVGRLLEAGVSREGVSLVMSEAARIREYGPDGPKVAEGAGVGGAMGGIAGAVIGGLIAVGSIVIPGAGLLAAGPLVAALAGAGAGGAAGSLIGALAALGLSEAETKLSIDAVSQGKILVAAFIDDAVADRAFRILRGEGGEDITAEAR